jgi:hypothetical protein
MALSTSRVKNTLEDASTKLTIHQQTQHPNPDDLNLHYHLTAGNSHRHQDISSLIQSQILYSLKLICIIYIVHTSQRIQSASIRKIKR